METGFVKVLPGNIILEPLARTWCVLPYPGHTNGCPNYGHKPTCPPAAPRAEEWLKGTSSLWLAYIKFNLASHVKYMLALHPYLSQRQARCVLYWQGGVNKRLRLYTEGLAADTQMWLSTNPRKVTYCPEAMGIDVIGTANRCGLPVAKNPVEYVYKIALVAGVADA